MKQCFTSGVWEQVADPCSPISFLFGSVLCVCECVTGFWHVFPESVFLAYTHSPGGLRGGGVVWGCRGVTIPNNCSGQGYLCFQPQKHVFASNVLVSHLDAYLQLAAILPASGFSLLVTMLVNRALVFQCLFQKEKHLKKKKKAKRVKFSVCEFFPLKRQG